MRIKDLATRATKLLTGNAYMVVDNGTKVEKIDYAELAKQIITEYNAQTLAGSAQSVKSALDALNSNKQNFSGVINDTRLPSSNQQIENVSIGQSRNIMYVGNNDTINELIFQSADTGSFSLSNLYSKISGFYMKKLDSEANNSVSFTLSGRGTVLAISNDSGGRSWIAVIGVSNTASLNNLTILKHDSDPNYDPTCSFSEKTVTLNIHPWENIVCISTVPFS